MIIIISSFIGSLLCTNSYAEQLAFINSFISTLFLQANKYSHPQSANLQNLKQMRKELTEISELVYDVHGSGSEHKLLTFLHMKCHRPMVQLWFNAGEVFI